MPSHVPPELRERLAPIRLVVLDVDGALTDGTLVYGPSGEALKHFNVRDGLGIRLLQQAGIQVAVLTGRRSDAVRARCRELEIPPDLVIQGSRDKDADLSRLQAITDVDDAATAAMGDDLPDLPMLVRAGFATCPADAAPEVAAVCDHACRREGGHGAVRELAELILKAQGQWTTQTSRWLGSTVRSGVAE
jgi:3-deoxy-D-manno-octulosonate 8-phosphate phosphatase (KDO 8-P phosphatase)